jgi:HK97 family phage major capsid protein/HK97 family phage prohead protease
MSRPERLPIDVVRSVPSPVTVRAEKPKDDDKDKAKPQSGGSSGKPKDEDEGKENPKSGSLSDKTGGKEDETDKADKNDEGNNPVKRTMYGHFSRFNNFYEIDSAYEGRFLERISPGAFNKTIQENRNNIKVLLEHGHDPTVANKPLGRVADVGEDEEGARYEVDLFDTSYVRDLIPALEAGVYGSSFRFRVVKDEWNYDPEMSDANPDGIPERTIQEVRLSEFGPTIYPANPEATASLRSSTDEYLDHLRSKDESAYNSIVGRIKPSDTSVSEETNSVTTESEPHVRSEAVNTPDQEPTTERHSEVNTGTGESRTIVQEDAMDRMTVEERAARQDEIRGRMAEIDSEHAGAALPPSADAEFKALANEYDEHERAIRNTEERKAALAARGREAREGEDRAGASTYGERVGGIAFHNRTKDIYDIEELRQSTTSEDQFRRKLQDNARSAIERAQYGLDVDKEAAQARAEKLLRSVDDKDGTLARRILRTGSATYERAFGKLMTGVRPEFLSSEEQRALSLVGNPPGGQDGGYAVPFQLDPTVILTSDGVINPLRGLARQVSIVGKEWQGITSEGVVVTRVPETTEATDDSPELDQPTVKAERVQGFVPFSVEIDQDWTAMRAELTMMLGEAKDDEEARAFLLGTGVAPDANGLLTTLDASSEVVGNLETTADIYRLKNALPPRFRRNAVFLGATGTYDDIRQLSSSNDGSDLWTRLADGRPGQLIGYKAEEHSEMPEYADAQEGDRFFLFGDFSKFLIVDRIGMNVELVPHLFGPTRRYPTGQRGIFAYWRNNSKVLVDNAFRVLVRDGEE